MRAIRTLLLMAQAHVYEINFHVGFEGYKMITGEISAGIQTVPSAGSLTRVQTLA